MSRFPFLCPHCGIKSLFDSVFDGQAGAVRLCANCGLPIWKAVINRKETIYPNRVPQRTPDVPENIEDDHVEAQLCYEVGALKATVAMCRRALQAVCIDKGATDDTLIRQIEGLFKKGVIVEALAEWAHEIRLWETLVLTPTRMGYRMLSRKMLRQC